MLLNGNLVSLVFFCVCSFSNIVFFSAVFDLFALFFGTLQFFMFIVSFKKSVIHLAGFCR